jgi:DNA-binding MarR family transcriptional regulator
MARPRATLSSEEIRALGRDCLAVRARMISRTVTRLYDDALRPHGLGVSQLNTLAAIARSDAPVRAGRVADLLSTEISTLSRNMRVLEREGWIAIEPAPRGNGRLLRLTPEGAQKLAEIKPAWEQAQTQVRALLGSGAEDLARIADALWAERAGDAATVPRVL